MEKFRNCIISFQYNPKVWLQDVTVWPHEKKTRDLKPSLPFPNVLFSRQRNDRLYKCWKPTLLYIYIVIDHFCYKTNQTGIIPRQKQYKIITNTSAKYYKSLQPLLQNKVHSSVALFSYTCRKTWSPIVLKTCYVNTQKMSSHQVVRYKILYDLLITHIVKKYLQNSLFL